MMPHYRCTKQRGVPQGELHRLHDELQETAHSLRTLCSRYLATATPAGGLVDVTELWEIERRLAAQRQTVEAWLEREEAGR